MITRPIAKPTIPRFSEDGEVGECSLFSTWDKIISTKTSKRDTMSSFSKN